VSGRRGVRVGAFGTHENAVAAGRLGGRPAADRIAKQVREREEVAAILHELGIVGVYGEQGNETGPGAYARRRGHGCCARLRDRTPLHRRTRREDGIRRDFTGFLGPSAGSRARVRAKRTDHRMRFQEVS
jgi:hypothetical protein